MLTPAVFQAEGSFDLFGRKHKQRKVDEQREKEQKACQAERAQRERVETLVAKLDTQREIVLDLRKKASHNTLMQSKLASGCYDSLKSSEWQGRHCLLHCPQTRELDAVRQAEVDFVDRLFHAEGVILDPQHDALEDAVCSLAPRQFKVL